MSDLPFDGVALRLGGRDWIVPALNLRQLKALAPRFALLRQVTADMGAEQIDALVEIAHAALARNYPTLAREEVAELVDMRNARQVVDAVIGAAGLKPASASSDGAGPGGSLPAGEARLGEARLGEGGAGSASSGSTGTV